MANIYKVKVDRSLHGSTLKCVAESTRKGYTSMRISIKYGPKFSNEGPIIYAASFGDNVEMSCTADSNPSATISWQRENSNVVISKETKLIHKKVQENDFGIYRCTAEALGFQSVVKIFSLAMKKAPVVLRPTVTYGRDGQPTTLSCSIESVPLPKDNEVRWTFQNNDLSKSNRHKSYQEAFVGGVVTVLQILSISSDDFGEYNCTVETSLGSASASVVIFIKNETHVFMIIGALLLFLLILLVATIMLYICRRSKHKKDYEKGNHPGPEIPVHHNVKATLIEANCHCNPNLYSWMSQSFDVKENRALLEKIQKDGSHCSQTIDAELTYPDDMWACLAKNNSIQINRNENHFYNHLVYDIQRSHLEVSDPIDFAPNFSFNSIPTIQNPNSTSFEKSQSPNYPNKDFCSNINLHIPTDRLVHDRPSPVYLIKNQSNEKQRHFPTDYYPMTKPKINPHIVDSYNG